jgi:hypothetical protein
MGRQGGLVGRNGRTFCSRFMREKQCALRGGAGAGRGVGLDREDDTSGAQDARIHVGRALERARKASSSRRRRAGRSIRIADHWSCYLARTPNQILLKRAPSSRAQVRCCCQHVHITPASPRTMVATAAECAWYAYCCARAIARSDCAAVMVMFGIEKCATTKTRPPLRM